MNRRDEAREFQQFRDVMDRVQYGRPRPRRRLADRTLTLAGAAAIWLLTLWILTGLLTPPNS